MDTVQEKDQNGEKKKKKEGKEKEDKGK